jgi:chondroitin synthase
MFKNETNEICEDVVGFANDYSFVENAKEKITLEVINKTKISVIIPFFERKDQLKLVLEGLCKQTVSPTNFEVLICDDGSSIDISDILAFYSPFFDKIKHLRNQKKGFGLSKVRNMGMVNSSHHSIILLDDDMIPTKSLVESHLRVILTNSYTLSIGFRKHAIVDNSNVHHVLSKKIELDELDWRVKGTSIELLTQKIKYNPYFCWSAASGGNIGFSRKLVEDKIFFDEDFNTWGGEDNEWAYRAYKEGYYFYPNYEALAIHQDEDIFVDKRNDESMRLLKSKCPRIHDAFKETNYHPNDVPLFSFWICNNNRGQFIKKAIQSIIAFPYRYEIIVVDDGSTDNSVQEVLSLNIPNLTLIRIPKNKLGYVYKTALDACRGEYLIQLDSDDYIDNLSNLVEICAFALNNPYGLVYGHHFHVDQDANFLCDGWIHEGCHREKLLFNGMHIHPPRIISKRDYSRARAIDITLETAVDYDLYSKIIEISYGYFYNLNAYAYRQHSGSISSNKLNQQKNDVARIICDRLVHYGVFDKYSFDATIKRSCIVSKGSHQKLRISNKKGVINENF